MAFADQNSYSTLRRPSSVQFDHLSSQVYLIIYISESMLIKKNWNPNMSFACIGDMDCTFADLGMEYLMRKVVDVGKFDRFMAVIYRE